MEGRRSDREGRSPVGPTDPEAGRAADAGSPDGEPRPYRWWDWEADVADLPDAVRPLAEAMARAVEAGEVPEDLGDVVADRCQVPLDEAWQAVSCLHRSLDRRQGSAPAEELSEVRAGLDEVAGRLWADGAEAEMEGVREFVRGVAHDLRSPLHSILFLTDALFREESGTLSRSQKRQVSVVHSAAAALLRMSNDLLDFSDRGDILPQGGVAEIPFSTAQVVDDLANLLEPVAHHHDAHLRTEVDDVDSRVGAPQVLNRILLNLACNALEAVEEDGTVRVRVGGDRDGVRAVVEDDGNDVEPERLRSLLDGGSYSCVMHRLGGHTRGLGLVICGRMVRAADGSLSVERTDGWTRFAVTLPFPVLEAET